MWPCIRFPWPSSARPERNDAATKQAAPTNTTIHCPFIMMITSGVKPSKLATILDEVVHSPPALDRRDLAQDFLLRPRPVIEVKPSCQPRPRLHTGYRPSSMRKTVGGMCRTVTPWYPRLRGRKCPKLRPLRPGGEFHTTSCRWTPAFLVLSTIPISCRYRKYQRWASWLILQHECVKTCGC
jgi:hypothetical protein